MFLWAILMVSVCSMAIAQAPQTQQFVPVPLVRPAQMPQATPEAINTAIEKGVSYLKTHQAEDGSFSSFAGIGVTALCVGALLDSGLTVDDPTVAKGLKYIEKFVQPNGSICDPDMMVVNYETCISVETLSKADKDGRYDKILKNTEKFIREGQYTQENGYHTDNLNYGGNGYGGKGRADMSNTTFFLDALKSLGAKSDDPAIQKAMVFVSRCQNLESPHNTTKFADKNPDGGFYYVVVGAKESDIQPNGGLRSYGSMTYAGIKSFIYANLDKTDPRYKAAMDWIAKNYTLEENPAKGPAGVYYYYVMFSKVMTLLGPDQFTDAQGKTHNWKSELASELIMRQQPDGSWKNSEANRWMENDPNLSTGYALRALTLTK